MSGTQRVVTGLCFEDIQLGMEETFIKKVSAEDVAMFGDVSGDTNPVHFDEVFAKSTPFGGRIAHGLLIASFLSTILGTKLPGPGAIYVSQSLNFRGPVRIDDLVTARAQVVSMCSEKFRVTFECECLVEGETVLDGEAVVLVPSRADRASGSA